MTARVPQPLDVQSLRQALARRGYLAGEGLGTALFCALRLGQPLLLEGEPGVGKTQAAKALADVVGTELIRLQCYEGIDASHALYEWNYPRQMLAIRLAEVGGRAVAEADLFSEEYLIERPLLRALRHPGEVPSVLLIDEIDRSDDEFEAFLLEALGEGSVTIPELGTVRATNKPVVILTSNRTRDLHDALKRRCLYHWIDYPDLATSIEILRINCPAASRSLIEQAARATARLRDLDMQKPPGVAESINWVGALELLGVSSLDKASIGATLGMVVKYREDLDLVDEAAMGALIDG